jgi:hypothetical protein
MLKRFLKPANRRARIFVGLMLVGLFCIQCVPARDHEVRNIAMAIADEESQEQRLARVRELASKDHAALLELCLANYHKKYGDFACTFIKQERIGGKVGPEQEMAVKFRQSPYSVAMAWTKNAPIGDRVLYLEGKYGGQMLVRPTNPIARALAPTVQRQPDGEEALRSTLRPVNQFGFERGIRSLIDVYRDAKKAGDLREEVDDQDQEVEGRKTILLIRTLPDGKGYPAHITKIYIDLECLLPIMIEGFGWHNDEFICRYLYQDIRFNTKWTDEDFIPERNDLVSPRK